MAEALDPAALDGTLDIPDVVARFCGDGTIDPALMPDFLHPSADGYRRMAEALEPALSRLLGE